jgi:glycosyltransferase involved in cell wall biosynthesis
MIFFDLTKTGGASHRSGLTRVSARLRESLGPAATAVSWDAGARRWTGADGVPWRREDWFLTTELFSEEERPGFTAFLRSRPGGRAALFHDAIPLKHPHITWPQSVARHPGYMKLLAEFDRVWAVSQASRAELLGFWQWQGIAQPPPVEVLALGADFDRAPRVTHVAPTNVPPRLLCLGILEPRKNQRFLLEVCANLWREGMDFELHLVGRVNPHFGRPVVARLRELQRTARPRLFFHEAADDATVAQLFASAHATLFPTLAEGCGLPLLESLWRGVPCVCSDLPVLRENADAGGCVPVALGDAGAWQDAIRRLLVDADHYQSLQRAATTRPLPTWAEAGTAIRTALAAPSPPPRDTNVAPRAPSRV